MMITTGLQVRLVAKPGKEQELESFLKSALPLVEDEPDTINWYAFKINENTFGLFDTFPDATGRNDHLAGKVAKALMEKAPDLLTEAPVIEFVSILASK